jgi:hypothetical protein
VRELIYLVSSISMYKYGDIIINTHVVVVNKVQPRYIIPNISNGIEETD